MSADETRVAAASTHSVEMADTCAHCGRRIVERYAGTFWKDGPTPTSWFHDRGEDVELRWERACSWAEPVATPPAQSPSGGAA